MNRMIELAQATCPECAVALDGFSTHMPRCSWPSVMANLAQNVYPSWTGTYGWGTQAAGHSVVRQTMLWDRVRPSLGDLCPRKKCGLQMSRSTQEHMQVWRCSCGYEAQETNSGMRADYAKVLEDLKIGRSERIRA